MDHKHLETEDLETEFNSNIAAKAAQDEEEAFIETPMVAENAAEFEAMK
jgi:hypothetical protein